MFCSFSWQLTTYLPYESRRPYPDMHEYFPSFAILNDEIIEGAALETIYKQTWKRDSTIRAGKLSKIKLFSVPSCQSERNLRKLHTL